jgi:hypothetical protein
MVSSRALDEPGKIWNGNTAYGDAMNKFDLVDDPAGMPARINALPELQLPAKFNITRALFERIEGSDCWNVPRSYPTTGASATVSCCGKRGAMPRRYLQQVWHQVSESSCGSPILPN